ncbi:hypothetical protein N7508_008622 [Penicillium antarcticum]|uniref:uncharacterized protein n=1 Tax=Penicillium antarcticum TaxID=416450 RepID=UPI0023A1C224|nr:uncharacterized protein N7508_008622 [Penicillium antarcticum]KAJ5293801.1 hypothetical protein N7508_008622 [Penicillium antarcticum]
MISNALRLASKTLARLGRYLPMQQAGISNRSWLGISWQANQPDVSAIEVGQERAEFDARIVDCKAWEDEM